LIRALGQLIVFATGGAGVANTSLIGITETWTFSAEKVQDICLSLVTLSKLAFSARDIVGANVTFSLLLLKLLLSLSPQWQQSKKETLLILNITIIKI
jgi:hypothetical protein